MQQHVCNIPHIHLFCLFAMSQPDRTTREPRHYRAYKHIDWYRVIQLAIASGSERQYCTNNNIIWRTYCRRKKEYKQLPPDERTTYKYRKATTRPSRRKLTLSAEQLASNTLVRRNSAGWLTPTKRNLSDALTAAANERQQLHTPDSPPIPTVGRGTCDTFIKQYMHTVTVKYRSDNKMDILTENYTVILQYQKQLQEIVPKYQPICVLNMDATPNPLCCGGKIAWVMKGIRAHKRKGCNTKWC
jgi:hypothetical protein